MKEGTVPTHNPTKRIAAVAALLGVLLVPTGALATYPAPTGTIAFSADAGSGAQIWTIRPNGHDLRQITAFDGDAVAPDWSPDGRRIVLETGHQLGEDAAHGKDARKCEQRTREN